MSIYFGSTPVGTRIYEPVTPPTPTYTSAQYFKFSGSTLTKYVGNETNIVLPISYSTTSEQRQFDGVVVPISAFSSAGIWGMYNYSITLAPTNDSSNTTVYNTMTDSDNLQQVYGDYVLLISATNNDGNDLWGIQSVLSNGAGFPMLINNTVCEDIDALNQIDWGNLQSVNFAGTGTIISFIDGNDHTVTEIGSNAFMNTGVQSIVISEGYTSIGNEAFSNLAISSLDIPASVTSIGSGITKYCTSLTTLTVNANNSYFDSRDNCNAIIRKADNCLVAGCVSTTMPSSVQRIGSYAFTGIPITSTMLNDNIVEIGDGAYQGTAITSVYFPANISQLNWGVFADCNSLSLTTIPSQITSISDNAFANVNFSNGLTIEGQVTWIGYEAFNNLNTNSITINSINPPSITESTFGGYSGQLTVYVPTGTVSAYQSDANWGTKNIVEQGGTSPVPQAEFHFQENEQEVSTTVDLTQYNNTLPTTVDGKQSSTATYIVIRNIQTLTIPSDFKDNQIYYDGTLQQMSDANIIVPNNVVLTMSLLSDKDSETPLMKILVTANDGAKIIANAVFPDGTTTGTGSYTDAQGTLVTSGAITASYELNFNITENGNTTAITMTVDENNIVTLTVSS